MTSQQRDFNLHFKTGPASAAITSVYLVGQRWRLPTRRQPGDRWAAHASVFILPEQTPKPQTAFAPLPGSIHRHHLHVLSCKNQTQPRQASLIGTFECRLRREFCFWGLQPQLHPLNPMAMLSPLPSHAAAEIIFVFSVYLNKPMSYTCLFHMKTNKNHQYFACWVVKIQESCSGFHSLGATPNISPRVRSCFKTFTVCSSSKNKHI